MTHELLYLTEECRHAHADWSSWLIKLAESYDRLLARGYLPFHDHECASVSVLLGAAYSAGYIGMAEYGVERGEGQNGRADLWFEANGTDYWFEFKRADAEGRWSLDWGLDAAKRCFGCVDFEQNEHGYAAVIAATHKMSDQKRSIYEAFASKVDIAVHFGPSGRRGAYLYFKRVRWKSWSQSS